MSPADIQPEHWDDVLDHLGTFLDDIIWPALGAWTLYIVKAAVTQFLARWRK